MVNSFKDFDPQLVFAEHSAGSDVSLTNNAKLSLYKKSQKSGIAVDILEEVYRRGFTIWNESFAGTPEQFAFDRVNSFISGGFAKQLDGDLMEKEVWDKPNPVKKHKTLSTAKKAAAKARAKAAGRPYPNLIDNMWAAQHEETDIVTMEQPYHPKDPNASHRKQFQADKMKEIKEIEKQKVEEALSPKQKAAQQRYKKRDIRVDEPKSNFDMDTHKVTAHVEKQGQREKVKTMVKAKDKHSAVFDTQMKYHKMGYKVHNVTYHGKVDEAYTGAEKTTTDFTKPASRFVGTNELTQVYKDMTPGQSDTQRRIKTIKEAVVESYVCENCDCGLAEELINERGADSKGYFRSTESGAGLTAKGAKHFGVQTAVTEKNPTGKRAARRRSFCARMSGMKGPMKDEKGRPTRKAMSLRRWRC